MIKDWYVYFENTQGSQKYYSQQDIYENILYVFMFMWIILTWSVTSNWFSQERNLWANLSRENTANNRETLPFTDEFYWICTFSPTSKLAMKLESYGNLLSEKNSDFNNSFTIRISNSSETQTRIQKECSRTMKWKSICLA